MNPKRYAIYFADLNPTMGSEISKVRPVVIVSQDAMNQYLETVVVCPLTSKRHPKWRSRLQVTCAGKAAEIAVDQIRTISKKRLKDKIDQLPARANQDRLPAFIRQLFPVRPDGQADRAQVPGAVYFPYGELQHGIPRLSNIL